MTVEVAFDFDYPTLSSAARLREEMEAAAARADSAIDALRSLRIAASVVAEHSSDDRLATALRLGAGQNLVLGLAETYTRLESLLDGYVRMAKLLGYAFTMSDYVVHPVLLDAPKRADFTVLDPNRECASEQCECVTPGPEPPSDDTTPIASYAEQGTPWLNPLEEQINRITGILQRNGFATFTGPNSSWVMAGD